MSLKKLRDESLLIIFYKNPEIGKVKTRLAASIGEAKAFSIYLLLSKHTRSIAERLSVHKALYYSGFIDTNDGWPADQFKKHLQSGADLGEKMDHAFQKAFSDGYKSICIIGTDCLELTTPILNEAFRKLLTNDIVVGPAKDGGYYLLGMNHPHSSFFQHKKWSTNSVLADTLDDIKLLGLKVWKLPTLTDVDEEKDLPSYFRI
jgi:rSAM/selenodomain-associated transferase 1